jgi:hypothetical protein
VCPILLEVFAVVGHGVETGVRKQSSSTRYVLPSESVNVDPFCAVMDDPLPASVYAQVEVVVVGPV